MSAIKMFEFTETELVQVANDARELTIQALVSQGYLTKSEADEFAETYSIIAEQPTMFRRLFGSNSPRDLKGVRLIFVQKPKDTPTEVGNKNAGQLFGPTGPSTKERKSK